MELLHNAQQQLIAQINEFQSTSHKSQWVSFDVVIENNEEDFNLLAWAKTPTDYPCFYFAFRDEPQKFLALGKVCDFNNLDFAENFVQTQSLPLVGGLTFDSQSYFYLPRLLIQQTPNQWQIRLFADIENSWQCERDILLTWIKTLKNNTALLPLTKGINKPQYRASESQWENWVKNALNAIDQQCFHKVVLANQNQFTTHYNVNAADLLAESEKQNLGCYHFLWAENNQKTFIGSSPERLYARHDLILNTEALAGTAPITADAKQNAEQGTWLLNDPKNDIENRLVVKDICQHLQDFCHDLQVSDVELKILHHVQHLRRKIQGKLKTICDSQCINAIHPTAAVAGLPRLQAIEFIKQTENFNRHWYAGTLGILEKNFAEFCVALRSAFVEQQASCSLLTLFAGAGIVKGSKANEEWQEINRKALSLSSLLAN